MNKPLLLILCILLIATACKQKEDRLSSLLSGNISFVNYDADTVLYKLQVAKGEEASIFRVTKGIYVNGAYFASDTKQNWDSARNVLAKDSFNHPVLKYAIDVLTNDKRTFPPLWYIEDEIMPGSYHIVLERGEDRPDMKPCLRVMLKDIVGHGFYALNFAIDGNDQWRLLSKETFNKQDSDERYLYNNTYCIDTTSKNLSTHTRYDSNRISFQDLLPEHAKTWECFN